LFSWQAPMQSRARGVSNAMELFILSLLLRNYKLCTVLVQ
jgi:hypothetical protein